MLPGCDLPSSVVHAEDAFISGPVEAEGIVVDQDGDSVSANPYSETACLVACVGADGTPVWSTYVNGACAGLTVARDESVFVGVADGLLRVRSDGETSLRPFTASAAAIAEADDGTSVVGLNLVDGLDRDRIIFFDDTEQPVSTVDWPWQGKSTQGQPDILTRVGDDVVLWSSGAPLPETVLPLANGGTSAPVDETVSVGLLGQVAPTGFRWAYVGRNPLNTDLAPAADRSIHLRHRTDL